MADGRWEMGKTSESIGCDKDGGSYLKGERDG